MEIASRTSALLLAPAPAFGAFVGGSIAFLFTVRVRPGWDRR